MILVFGMHRSGTSTVTGILSRLGFNCGDDLLPPAQDNPKGFYEDSGIMGLNENYLRRCGSGWCSSKPFKKVDREMFVSALKTHVGNKRLTLIKDPRMCLLVDEYTEAFPHAKSVIVYRPKEQVVKSLQKRNGDGDWGRLYDRYIDCLSGFDAPVISYEDVLFDWRKEFKSLEEKLGVEFDWSRGEDIDDFVTPSLKHN